MAAPPPVSPSLSTVSNTSATTQRYTSALSAVTTLFFLWGFITCLNDILIPYLKAIFQLSFAQANLINLCFFGAYFLMSIPAGKLVARVGYKRGMLLGFVVAAVGAFLFYPAAAQRAYGLFLGALFVLASGITLLQVAANPYVAILGPPESASARLTLTQAFNSLGTTLAPLLGSALILSHLPKLDTAASAAAIDVRAVQLPYLVIGGALLLISLLLSRVHLPVIEHAATDDEMSASELRRAWSYRHLAFGVIGIFAYVGAEVAIGSHIVSYLSLDNVMADLLTYVKGMLIISEAQKLFGFNIDNTEAAAGVMVSFYWGAAMIGRFAGAYLLNKFSPAKLLAFNAVFAVALILISISTTGPVAMWSLLAVGLMNSVMYPIIFTLAVAGLGRLTEEGSGLLCTAIVGGALVPLLFGFIADHSSLRMALLLPVVCYLYIMWYGLRGSQRVDAA
ncbi:sugar MFS transporter [Hymenobacter sp. BT186]|uniref:Sugar MFS transporter n=1 Tax=Hymenobacter telluris TaxID=2816474 RepID=A0A939EVH5_9BACT|nr:sugar MFS transporter [Hymenobacter telluris]MBO0358589.1 sugar MFS transporter [Hymenobacter telluris]MBW3374615.1 sugar MFS transporter [Hymenobacter norwichensis]